MENRKVKAEEEKEDNQGEIRIKKDKY